MTRTEIWNKAQKALFEKYGESPDINIVNRLLSEKKMLAHFDFGVVEYFDELAGICRESIEKYNEKLIAKAPVHTCLSAYLLGASEINPLPPHYICTNPECKRVEWLDDLDNDKCLFDMKSTHKCICGAEMHADGYGLEWKLYLPYVKKHKEKKDGIFGNRYHDLFESILSTHFQKNLLGATQICHLLGQVTGVAPDEIDLNDREVKYRLLGGDFSCMHPKLAEFLKQAYTVVQPCCYSYSELLKLIGLAKGTGTWKNNAEELLIGKCRLADIPATRDDVFMMIRDAMQKSIKETGFAFEVSEKARRGYYAENGIDGYTLAILKEQGFKDWFVSYLLGTRYLSTRALSVLELRYIVLLTYYKTYYPKEFEEILAGEDVWKIS